MDHEIKNIRHKGVLSNVKNMNLLGVLVDLVDMFNNGVRSIAGVDFCKVDIHG